ncbi:MAG TPA: hypothetical protein VF765_06435 [Polyangiaceae bacterium]
MRATASTALFVCVGVLTAAFACSSSGPSRPPQQTGSSCTTTTNCYPGIDAATLKGTATCLTQLQGGYCTHTCTSDSDCCAVPGECPSGFTEVCAPLESAPQTYCFLSCSSTAIAAAPNGGTTDPTAYCQSFANPTFTCRSTGGGSANQKFCGP